MSYSWSCRNLDGFEWIGWMYSNISCVSLPFKHNIVIFVFQIQCLLEESWSGGGDTVTFDGWIASVPRMTARAPHSSALALLRRAPHPPYPLTRQHPPHPPHPPPPPDRPPLEGDPFHTKLKSLHKIHQIQSH